MININDKMQTTYQILYLTVPMLMQIRLARRFTTKSHA